MKKKLILAAAITLVGATTLSLPERQSSPSATPDITVASAALSNTRMSASPVTSAAKPPGVATKIQKPQNFLPSENVAQNSEVDALPLLEPVDENQQTRPPELELWQISEGASPVVVDGLAALEFKLDPKRLQSLQVGQTIRFELPENATPIEAEITNTYNDPGGIQVWKGQIRDEVRHSSVIITQGKTQTHIIVASTHGNFSVVMDNQSGVSTLVDESAIHERQPPIDDGIIFPSDEAISAH